MKTYFHIVSVAFLFLLCFSCRSDKSKRCSSTMQSQKSYIEVCEILDTISSRYKEGYVKLGYIEFPFTLNEDVRFGNLLANPCDYRKFLMTIIKDDSKEKMQKLIALYGLQHLCADDYIEVLNTVFLEYKNKKVDEGFLMSAINQGGFSLEVCKNYPNKQLQDVLKNILLTLAMDSNKVIINDILNGRCWENLRKYFKESGEPMPWTCN